MKPEKPKKSHSGPRRPRAAEAAATTRRRIREGHLSTEQLGALFGACRGPMELALLKLIYFYGLRASEPGLIRLDEVNFEKRTIEVFRLKGSKSGRRDLPADLAAALREWVEVREPTDSPWLFPWPTQPHYKDHGVERHVVARVASRVAKRAGLDIGKANLYPHALKHTTGTHLGDAGMTLAQIADHLGHARLSSAEHYVQLSERARKTKGTDVLEQELSGKKPEPEEGE